MDPDSFISGNFHLIRLFIFCYICTVKNTVRECSQFIQNKEQNVNYSVLYRNYLFDTRRVIQYAFWRSNTALDGLLINQSNRLFLSGCTISSKIFSYIVYVLSGPVCNLDF